MKVFISADIEGTAGIAHWNEADRTHPDWAEFRALMTAEVVTACEGARALFLTHAQGELIARINGFFGFPAVRQIRIVQKPVSQTVNRRRKPQPLRGDAAKRLDDMMDGIESEALRKAVERLGTAVLQKKPPQRTLK